MKIKHQTSKIAVSITLFFVAISSPASACVGCREPGSLTLARESPTVLAGVAFSWSVLFMLGFVMLVVLGMSAFIWRTCRQVDKDKADKGSVL